MRLLSCYKSLLKRYGRQHWWPSRHERKKPGYDPRFEICVGAILTQNTNWGNVEKAIDALYAKRCLTAQRVMKTPTLRLASWIKPSGYFNQKAKKLKIFSEWYRQDVKPSREALLSLWGIGRETADSILLYAYGHPIFVVDAYTRRFLRSLGEDALSVADYDEIRAVFEAGLPADSRVYNEFHALIVRWGMERSG